MEVLRRRCHILLLLRRQKLLSTLPLGGRHPLLGQVWRLLEACNRYWLRLAVDLAVQVPRLHLLLDQ